MAFGLHQLKHIVHSMISEWSIIWQEIAQPKSPILATQRVKINHVGTGRTICKDSLTVYCERPQSLQSTCKQILACKYFPLMCTEAPMTKVSWCRNLQFVEHTSRSVPPATNNGKYWPIDLLASPFYHSQGLCLDPASQSGIDAFNWLSNSLLSGRYSTITSFIQYK